MIFEKIFKTTGREDEDIEKACREIMKDMDKSRAYARGYWKGRIESWKDVIEISKAFIRELEKSKNRTKIEEGVYIAYKKQAKQFEQHCFIYETAFHKIMFELNP